jgi:quinol-cytochrome oxidoreductase complex cytochrome b subunit
VFFILVLIVTGILELFYYIPTPEEAAVSVQTLTYHVPLGGFIRNMHYWAAQLLMIAILVHLLRVIFTGSYAAPRKFNYLLGLALLTLAVSLNFSGYVLRWDQDIHWAMVVSTNLVNTIPVFGPSLYRIIVGGSEPGGATLIRFYAWHVFGLTLPLIFAGVWHLFRVRRDGGIAVPPASQRAARDRITRDELVRRELLAALLALCFLGVVALTIPAPIGPAIVEGVPPTSDALAPWFFLWVQNLLRFGDPFWMGITIPAALLLFLALVPYLFPFRIPEQLGRWFPRGGRFVQLAASVITISLFLLTMQAILIR